MWGKYGHSIQHLFVKKTMTQLHGPLFIAFLYLLVQKDTRIMGEAESALSLGQVCGVQSFCF